MASTQRLVQMLGLELPRSAFCISYGEHSTSSIDAGLGTPQLEALCIFWRALNLKYRCWGQISLEALSVYLKASTQPLVQILGLKLRRRFLYILWRALNVQYRCWGQNSLEALCMSFGEHSTSSIDAGVGTPQKLSVYLMASTQALVQMLGLELPGSAFCISYGEHRTSSIDDGVGTPQLEALSVYLMASTQPLVQMLGLELLSQKRFLYILWRALNLKYRCWGWNSLTRSGRERVKPSNISQTIIHSRDRQTLLAT